MVEQSIGSNRYYWNGMRWIDARTHAIVPQALAYRLSARAQAQLEAQDDAVDDLNTLMRMARHAREAGQLPRAERLARRAVAKAPRSAAAHSLLCSVLRARGRPQDAIDASAGAPRCPSVLTTRAAAFCDMGRWVEARREINEATSVHASAESQGVLRRIHAARGGF